MTLELLQFIRDNTIHLQGHQYRIIQVSNQYEKKHVHGKNPTLDDHINTRTCVNTKYFTCT